MSNLRKCFICNKEFEPEGERIGMCYECHIKDCDEVDKLIAQGEKAGWINDSTTVEFHALSLKLKIGLLVELGQFDKATKMQEELI